MPFTEVKKIKGVRQYVEVESKAGFGDGKFGDTILGVISL